MNATVARIVELLFEDLVMTEEVTAIKDELMNNCQERFEDMITAGMSEDEATGAVVESLKGMEEVLAEYPRKVEAGKEDQDGQMTFRPEQVDVVNVNLRSADVYVDASDDGMIHVDYDREECEGLRVRLEDKKLVIDEEPIVTTGKSKHAHFEVHSDIKINSLADIGKLLKNIRINAAINCDMIRICLPVSMTPDICINTTSGDIDVRNIHPSEMKLNSTSGDLDVTMDESHCLKEAKLNTVSGDINAELCSTRCSVSTMSGDVELGGAQDQVWVSSVSGDVRACVDAVQMEFKTVSGDATVSCLSQRVQTVQGNTVSGDIELHLPENVGAVLQTQTTSGEVRNHAGNRGAYTAQVTLKTISGDMTIR